MTGRRSGAGHPGQATTGGGTMRLFAAIPVPTAAVTDLAEVVADLHIAEACTATRLSPGAQWHITVAFCGDIPTTNVDQLRSALAAATAGAKPLNLWLAGGGRFGRGRYSVVYAGVDGDVDNLVALAMAVRGKLAERRLPVDSKQFRPHVTLARPGDRITNEQSAADLLVLRRYNGPQWNAEQLVLYRSDFGHQPRGEPPHYEPVATFPLGDP